MLYQGRTKVVSRSYLVEFLIPPLLGSVVHEELRSLISIWMASLRGMFCALSDVAVPAVTPPAGQV